MRQKKQKIGILSGTFDPVHQGHVQFSLDAITNGKLDRVYLMVERRPRRKQGVKAFEHRQAMVQLAIADEPMLGSIITDELQFTAEKTLPLLQKRFAGAKLYLLMGDDMTAHLSEWPQVDNLLKSVGFLIGVRSDLEKAQQRIEAIKQARGVDFSCKLFVSSKPAVSSSRIRRQIKAHKIPRDLHPDVLAYIRQENLYVSDGDSASA